jgi:hypothetical protein
MVSLLDVGSSYTGDQELGSKGGWGALFATQAAQFKIILKK